MLKIRIVHKGLILVAVPLIFGVGFISLLCNGLSEANRLVDRELLFKDAIISHIVALKCSADASMARVLYMSSNNPYYKDYYVSNTKKALAADRHLRKLLKHESLSIPRLPSSYHQFLMMGAFKGHTTLTTSPFLRKLQYLSDQQDKAAMSAVRSFQLILYGGMAAGALTSVALAVFFCLSITNRLLIIVNNTLSLSKGAPLTPPVKGSDEIAELDQFLFNSATEIRELERFKKEVIGVISHELKSPLASLGAFLNSLGEGVFGELSARGKDKARRTCSSVKRLMGLVSELLYLDRLELELNREEVNIEGVIADAVDSVKELSEQSGIEIVAKCERGKLFADRNRLVQVIVNLLSNAMKFSPPGGKVTVETSEKETWFECRVSDQGRGIPEEFRKQIFDPFKQVDAKDAVAKKGTGLGLAITRSIIEQHGGLIGVDSEEGKGSTFWFKIPLSNTPHQISTKECVPDRTKERVANSIKSSDEPDGSTSEQSSSRQSSRNKKIHAGKFSVLQQGFVIIAVPLVFQIGFVGVIGYMLNQVCEQVHREENSIEILDSLTRMADSIVGSAGAGIGNVYVLDPLLSRYWETGKRNALHWLGHATHISQAEPERIKGIVEVRHSLEEIFAVFDHELATGESKAIFDRVGGPFKEMTFACQVPGNLSGYQSTMQAERAMSDISGSGAMGGFGLSGEMMEGFRSWSTDPLHTNLMSSYSKFQAAQDRIMSREKKKGEHLSKQRSEMINALKETLLGGICCSIILSIFLAVFLMRSLTSRLRHVMDNTAKLVKREQLSPPIGGSDEIAYLDLVLFETGNRLMELETFKRQLISIVSHELRTPLMSISSALEVFETGMLGDLSEEGKVRLRNAEEETERLICLINDLLDMEKMEAGKFVLDASEVPILEPVEAAISAVAQLAQTRKIKVESTITESDGTVWADRDRLCQVLVNLLSNAIKCSPENGTVLVTAGRVDGDKLKFCVMDHGKGISEELKQKIFDRFAQIEKNDEAEQADTGLSLALAKAIVEQHGGSIGVDSTMWEGSTFWFTIPANPVKNVNNGNV